MICPKCGRLNPDGSASCPYCSEILNREKYEENLSNSATNLTVKTLDAEPAKQESPKYFKTGWLFAAAFLVIITAAIVIICNLTSPVRSIVSDYAQSFYYGDFQKTAMSSAVNLEKCYNVQSQSSFENFFGLFSAYSGYEDMLNAYSNAFTENKAKIASVYGDDYKVDVDIEKTVKVNEAVLYSCLEEYSTTYGDVLRSGEITEMRYVYATITVKGSLSQVSEITQYIVLEIAGEWYVLTNDTLDSVSNI